MKSSLWPRTLLPLAIFLVALLMRVVPAWDAAYGDGYPNLQGGDSYYHLRSVEALIANFPKRPEFDPYAIYPGGMAVLTGPFLDYLIAILALVLGMGSPSPELVRHVAAWVPPLFGAVTVFPLFWLGLRLFGTAGAAAGAFFFAVCPGHTVFYAKLGSADHHVFEALFYAWVLAALAAALDPLQSSRGLYAIAAGVAVGFALLNRPAAAFLSPVFGIWAGLQAGLAPEGARANRSAVWATVGALLLGWLFLFPGGAGAWGVLPHALMAAGIVAALVGWLSAEWAQARGIPRWAWAAALVGVVVVAGALLWFAGPRFLIERVRSALDALLGLGSTLVAEARPTVRDGFKPLLKEVGPLGLLAPPLWAAMAWIALRTKSRPLSLVSGTGLAMYAGTLAQERMSIYGAISLALLAGWFWVEATAVENRAARWLRGGVAAALLYGFGLYVAPQLASLPQGMSPEWREAAEWLRTATPDPLGDPRAFWRDYAKPPAGQAFAYPPSAYGVAVWWDIGYFVLAEGRRPPTSNGTQGGAPATAAFYVETDPARAVERLDAAGTRYVIADDTLPMLQPGSDPDSGEISAMLAWVGEPLTNHLALLDRPVGDGETKPVLVFLPRYFESMGMRLYLHDGEAYEPQNATTVFSLRPGRGPRAVISSQRTFPTYEEAQRYVEARPGQDLLIGTVNPIASCVPLEPVPGLRKVFESGPEDFFGPDRLLHTIKIFERTAEPAGAAAE